MEGKEGRSKVSSPPPPREPLCERGGAELEGGDGERLPRGDHLQTGLHQVKRGRRWCLGTP